MIAKTTLPTYTSLSISGTSFILWTEILDLPDWTWPHSRTASLTVPHNPNMLVFMSCIYIINSTWARMINTVFILDQFSESSKGPEVKKKMVEILIQQLDPSLSLWSLSWFLAKLWNIWKVFSMLTLNSLEIPPPFFHILPFCVILSASLTFHHSLVPTCVSS